MFNYSQVKEVVSEVIRLAIESEEFGQLTNECYNLEITDEMIQKLLIGNKKLAPVRDYLNGLDGDMVYYVMAIMYIGRDGLEQKGNYEFIIQPHVNYLKETFERKSYVINQMLQKSPLITYLRQGISLIESSN